MTGETAHRAPRGTSRAVTAAPAGVLVVLLGWLILNGVVAGEVTLSKLLAYAIVTGLLVGVYAGLVLLATHVLAFQTLVAVAVSTLAAVALFTPLRRRVQHIVDRRFNRASYDADRTVASFATRLQDAVDLGSIHDDLFAVVTSSLEPAHVSIWIAGGDR